MGKISAAIGAFAASGVTRKVLDPQGLPVEGDTVHLDTAVGYRISFIADGEGRYQFDPIPDGVYQLKSRGSWLTENLGVRRR